MPIIALKSCGLLVRVPDRGANSVVKKGKLSNYSLMSLYSDSNNATGVLSRWLYYKQERGATAEHPWDSAHRLHAFLVSEDFADSGIYVEPDLLQEFPYRFPESHTATDTCEMSPPDEHWSWGNTFAWHLDTNRTQLRDARNHVRQSGNPAVRIGILDTGYDRTHDSRPANIADEHNFEDAGHANDARDPGGYHGNPGHGTATIAILAGQTVQRARDRYYPAYNDSVGAAPDSTIVPVRIANSVIHFFTRNMALGIQWCIDKNCRVISISAGGLPALSWVDAVNHAYDSGVAIFAAAGNTFGLLPHHIVWPARFDRVTAVCGATYKQNPYDDSSIFVMHGCYGPNSKMDTAIAAYTPNIPWAELGCQKTISLDGAGTSCATPQAAAAAALWYQQNPAPAGATGPQIVERMRNALFETAVPCPSSPRSTFKYMGNGLLRARDALDVTFARSNRPELPPDTVDFRWLRRNYAEEAEGVQQMFEVEALQLYSQSVKLNEITDNADPKTDQLSKTSRKRLIARLRDSKTSSEALKKYLEKLYRQL